MPARAPVSRTAAKPRFPRGPRALRAAFLAAALLLPRTGGARGAAPSAGAGETALTLDEAMQLALSANEALAAARLRLPVASAGVAVARQRPNPDLTLDTQRETPRDSMTLSLPIETAGKRGRRIRVAEAGVRTGEAEMAQAVLALRYDVRRAYFGLSAAQRQAAEAEELLRLAERVRDAAKDRFEAGDAPRLDVLQAELGAEQAENEVAAARASVVSARTELNVLLARGPDRPTKVAGDLGGGEVPGPEAAVDVALASSAELAALDGRILEETARLDLARAERWPDVTVEGAATHRAFPEFDWGWRAALVVSLPLFQHGAAQVQVEETALAQLRAERQAVASRVRGAVFADVAVASAQREQYQRYRERVLPQVDEVQRMAEDSYRSGQTGLLAMIQAIQAVRDLRGKAIQAGLDYQIALAELERAIGVPLP